MSKEKKQEKSILGVTLKQWAGLLGAFAVGAAVMMMPTPAGLSITGQKALGLFAAILVLWATEPVPLPIVSLLMVPAAIFTGAVPAKGAVAKTLESFATSSAFLIAGSLIMSEAMSKTGFAARMIYTLMSKIGSSVTRITLGIMLANIVLAFMVPSSSARTAVLLPICLGLIEVFRKSTGQAGRSTFAVTILLTLAFTNATISAGILTATIPNPITVGMIAKASGYTISYQEWFIYGFPPALIMTIFTWWFIGRVFKPELAELPGGKEFIQNKLDEMGKMKVSEWQTAFVFLGVVILWMTGSMTKIDSTIAVLMGVVALYVFRVITWADANKTPAFQFMMLLGGGFLIANMLIDTKAADWAAAQLFKMLSLNGASTLVVLLVVMLVVQYLHIPFMGTTKMTTMVMPIVIGLAASAKVPVVALAMPAGMLIGGYPLFLFYNTIPNLLVYGTNELKMSDFPKVGFVVCTLAVILYAACATTYWRWLGLF